MKVFITLAVLSFCASVSAQEKEMFSKAKEHSLSNIDKRIGYLNELKSCVSSASDMAAVKACRQAHKTKVKALKDENESFRESMKSERQARRDARKKK